MEKLEKTASQNEMIRILAQVFNQSTEEEIDKICYYLVGQIYPSYKHVTLGMGEKMVQTAIALAGGKTKEVVEKKTREIGDLGEVASQLVKPRKNKFDEYLQVEGELTVADVHRGLEKIATTSGTGSQEVKIKTLASMMLEAENIERKYLTRLVTGTMRLGVGDMTVLDGLAVAFLGSKEKRPTLEHAYNLSSDIGQVAQVLLTQGVAGIKEIEVTVNRPLKPMLAQRVSRLSEIKEKIDSEVIAVEEKYDGERIQVHKQGETVTLFSRRLTDITGQFPEVVENVRNHVDVETAILDGEAVAYNFEEEEFYPFQKLMHRRRKYEVEEYAEEFPVRYMVFDVLYVNGRSLIRESYPKRREELEKLLENHKYIALTRRIVSTNLEEIDEYFQRCLERGAEGIICKSCSGSSYYEAGARGWSWIKWKKEYASELSDTFDLVVVGGYAGRGKRSGTYGSLLCAAYNHEKDVFQTVCKLGTGFTDEQLETLPKKFQDLIVEEKPARVEVTDEAKPDYWFVPKFVVEILGSEITKSPVHTCAQEIAGNGLSLRFPRLQRWRPEKGPEQATTAKEVLQMFKRQ